MAMENFISEHQKVMCTLEGLKVNFLQISIYSFKIEIGCIRVWDVRKPNKPMRNRIECLKWVIKSFFYKWSKFYSIAWYCIYEGLKVSYLLRILQFNHLFHPFIALNTVINLECLYYFRMSTLITIKYYIMRCLCQT